MKGRAKPKAGPRYVLRLYVAGDRSTSVRAIANVKAVCEEHLRGRCTLEVIDLYLQPHLVHDELIVAVPILIKLQPPPLKRMIGDLSDKESVLRGLDIVVKR